MAKKKNNKTKKARAYNEYENALYLNDCKRIVVKGQGTPPGILELKDVVANVDRLYISEKIQDDIQEHFRKLNENFEKEIRKDDITDSEQARRERARIGNMCEKIHDLFSVENADVSEILICVTGDNGGSDEYHAEYITCRGGYLFIQTLVLCDHKEDGLCLQTTVCNLLNGSFSTLPNNHKLLTGVSSQLVKGISESLEGRTNEISKNILPSLLKILTYLTEYLEALIASSILEVNGVKSIDFRKRGISRKKVEFVKETVREIEGDAYEQCIEQCTYALGTITEKEFSVSNSPFFIEYQEKFEESDIISLSKLNLEKELGDIIPRDSFEKFLEIPRYFDDITIKIYGNVSYHIEYLSDNVLLVNALIQYKKKTLILSISLIEFSTTGSKVVSIMNKIGDKIPSLSFLLGEGKEFNTGVYVVGLVMKLIAFVYEKLNAIRENSSKKKRMAHYIEGEPMKKLKEKKAEVSEVKAIDKAEETPSRIDRIRKVYNLDKIDDTIQVIFRKRGLNTKVDRKPMRQHKVTGFWRHYKSGKKTWINPYTRGKSSAGSVKKEIHFE